jgi:hypothetical protein
VKDPLVSTSCKGIVGKGIGAEGMESARETEGFSPVDTQSTDNEARGAHDFHRPRSSSHHRGRPLQPASGVLSAVGTPLGLRSPTLHFILPEKPAHACSMTVTLSFAGLALAPPQESCGASGLGGTAARTVLLLVKRVVQLSTAQNERLVRPFLRLVYGAQLITAEGLVSGSDVALGALFAVQESPFVTGNSITLEVFNSGSMCASLPCNSTKLTEASRAARMPYSQAGSILDLVRLMGTARSRRNPVEANDNRLHRPTGMH